MMRVKVPTAGNESEIPAAYGFRRSRTEPTGHTRFKVVRRPRPGF